MNPLTEQRVREILSAEHELIQLLTLSLMRMEGRVALLGGPIRTHQRVFESGS